MEEDEGKDGAGAEADGMFDYSTLAEAMDATDDEGSDGGSYEEDLGIDGLGGGPGGSDGESSPEASGKYRSVSMLLHAEHWLSW